MSGKMAGGSCGSRYVSQEKLLIQWIEPTYCSFNQTRYQYRPQGWVEDLYTGQANERALAFLNRFQGNGISGGFGYYLRILLGKLKGVQVLPGIIFLGGFFITILWGGQEPLCVSLYRHDPALRACSMEYYGRLLAGGIGRIAGGIASSRERNRNKRNRKDSMKNYRLVM